MIKPLLSLFLLCFLSLPGFAAKMPPVRMKVVDAQDGSPMAGVFVMFQASAREGTWTGHGGRLANLFVVETVTDDAGELRLPAQEFSAQPFFLNTNYHNPSMVLLKPGYELVILMNTRRIIAELQDVTTWQYDQQTVRMKRATTDKDQLHAVTYAALQADQTLSENGLCAWKNIPRFLVAVDRLADEWNRKRGTLADTALRNRTAASTLQGILMNDKFFTEQACGSPKAFFEPYLR